MSDWRLAIRIANEVVMRLVFCVLACAGVGGIIPALADPPANVPATAAPSASATPAPQPAAASQPAAPPGADTKANASSQADKPADKPAVVVQSTPEIDYQEKHFLAMGYKPEMRNGEKVYCRREEQLGSRLGGQKVCATAQQLEANEREAKNAYQRGQTQQNNPSGK